MWVFLQKRSFFEGTKKIKLSTKFSALSPLCCGCYNTYGKLKVFKNRQDIYIMLRRMTLYITVKTMKDLRFLFALNFNWLFIIYLLLILLLFSIYILWHLSWWNSNNPLLFMIFLVWVLHCPRLIFQQRVGNLVIEKKYHKGIGRKVWHVELNPFDNLWDFVPTFWQIWEFPNENVENWRVCVVIPETLTIWILNFDEPNWLLL